MSVALLGQFEITVDGKSLRGWRPARFQSAIGYLVLHRSQSIHRQTLAARLWPNTPNAQARTNLRNLLHLIRRAEPQIAAALTPDSESLAWRPETQLQVDVDVFTDACQNGQTDHALAGYTGDLLPDCYDEWVLVERNRLQNLYLAQLVGRLEHLEGSRQYLEAVHLARRYLAFEPLHEAMHRRLMRLWVRVGDRAGALQVYHDLAGLLQRELGTPPCSETQRLYADILLDRLSDEHPDAFT